MHRELSATLWGMGISAGIFGTTAGCSTLLSLDDLKGKADAGGDSAVMPSIDSGNDVVQPRPDSGLDTGTDSPVAVDAPPDTQADVPLPVDGGIDAPLIVDAPRDAPPDVQADSPVDAGLDSPEVGPPYCTLDDMTNGRLDNCILK